ncbi:MAG: FHA domain-containing protein [Chloroflexi bacterium]|nr:FHA domain-containing protein [Chloroflexota bacterium]
MSSSMDQDFTISVAIMSGVEDGMILEMSPSANGSNSTQGWSLSIGRRDDNDVCLRNDTYVSRFHALVHYRGGSWWLEDCNSKNGTFLEDASDDARVSGTVPLEAGQLFRVGRTWLRLQA